MDARSAVQGLVEMVDWNINFAQVLTIAFIAGGLAYTIKQMKDDVKDIKAKMKEDFKDIKAEMEAVTALITGSAVLSKRVDHIEDDIREIRKDMNDLRHGDGWVQGRHGIDREYPP